MKVLDLSIKLKRKIERREVIVTQIAVLIHRFYSAFCGIKPIDLAKKPFFTLENDFFTRDWYLRGKKMCLKGGNSAKESDFELKRAFL
jgi:hypothetical protein